MLLEACGMSLIPSLMSRCGGACRSPNPRTLLFIRLHVTTLVLLPSPAPTGIVSAKAWNGLRPSLCGEYFFEEVHVEHSDLVLQKLAGAKVW